MSVAINQITDLRHLEVGPELSHCFAMSESVWEARIDGELACIWGLIPPTLMSTQAYLWLHTTEVAEEHTFLLVRYSQLWIRHMLETFPTIVGHVARDAERSQRWLRWLGAKLGKPDDKLIPFKIEATPYNCGYS